MQFEAILFDCDGVLVDSETIYLEVERQHLARIGLIYEAVAYQNRFNGLAAPDFFALIEQEYRDLGKGGLPDGFAEDLERESVARIDSDLTEIDGIKGFLDAHQGPRAVASSSRLQRLHRKLAHTGLTDYFAPHIYSGEQVANGKPKPDLFLFSATKLAVDPARCLVIEDSVNGILAGLAAGMTVWGFTGGGHCHPGHDARLADAGAHRVVENHAELSALLLD